MLLLPAMSHKVERFYTADRKTSRLQWRHFISLPPPTPSESADHELVLAALTADALDLLECGCWLQHSGNILKNGSGGIGVRMIRPKSQTFAQNTKSVSRNGTL